MFLTSSHDLKRSRFVHYPIKPTGNPSELIYDKKKKFMPNKKLATDNSTGRQVTLSIYHFNNLSFQFNLLKFEMLIFGDEFTLKTSLDFWCVKNSFFQDPS